MEHAAHWNRVYTTKTEQEVRRELVARREEMLKELCGTAYVPIHPDGISVHLGPEFTKH
jgi:hypothetical protein